MSKLSLILPGVAAHGSGGAISDAVSIQSYAMDLAALVLLATVVFFYSAAGFVGSDDANYIAVAYNILHGGMYLPTFFGDFRYTVILPVTACIALLGGGGLATGVPTFLYAAGILTVAYVGMRVLTDRSTALLATLLFIAVPLLPQLSLTVGDDVPELFFSALSLMMALWGFKAGRGWPVFLMSGIAAGLAFMTRESAIGLLALYGLWFLLNYGNQRSAFFVMGAGFVLVFLPGMTWYAVATGNPFYQEVLVLHAMQTAPLVQATGPTPFSSGQGFNIHLLLNAPLFALFHPLLGLVFAVAVGAAVWAFSRRSGTAGSDDPACLCRWFCVYALLGFLVSGLILGYLALIPRYFLVPLFAAIMAVAVWLRTALLPRHRAVCFAVIIVLLGTDVAGVLVTNANPLFAERALTALAAKSSQQIHVSPETLVRGEWLFQWAGVRDRITDTPPEPNDLFLFDPKYSLKTGVRTLGFDQRTKQFNLQRYEPKANWVVVETLRESTRLIARLLHATRLDAVLPKRLVQHMASPNPAAILYRVPRQTG